MLVRSHHDPRDFLELVEPFLLTREVENALPLGIARSFVEHATHDGLMFSVESGQVVAVAVKSPKRNLVITAAPELALQALANYLNAYAFPVPGVNGPYQAVLDFGRAWCAVSGMTMVQRIQLRIFEVRQSLPTPANVAPGQIRQATLDDGERVERWLRAFLDEATHDPHDHVRERVARMIGAGSVWLWMDAGGEAVSMASTIRRSPSGSAISWVYTPPAKRKQGYASACVAELTRRELAAGRSFVTLYADVANAGSNRIYERMGYVSVCDALDATFH